MEKFLEFGRKALFYVRVLSGYEERRIRSFRLQLQQRLDQAQARKLALKKIPEQIILSEVCHMVEHMRSVNKQLEETETAIQKVFDPIEKEVEMLMKVQLDGEEKSMKRMLETMREQTLLEEAEADRVQSAQNVDTNKQKQVLKSDSAPKVEI